MEGVSYLIDPVATAKIWETLDEAANVYLTLSDEEIEVGEKAPYTINGFFESCVGSSIVAPHIVMATYSGTSHGGYTDIYIENSGKKESYLDAIEIDNSIDALIGGLYIAFELPTKAIFWHGLYGRDYTFKFDSRWRRSTLQNKRKIPPRGEEMNKIGRPNGVRVTKTNGMYRVSCLASYPNCSIVDLSIQIKNGHFHKEPEELVQEPKITVFY